MSRTTSIAAPLMFASGFCALIYQVVWTRELRFIFGASTAASSAVIAIFIAGLGFGGLWFGQRVERSARPFLFYAKLEFGIAVASALTPWLLELVRVLYNSTGGSLRLGLAGASAVRLLLSTLVLGPATFLMGGTLPAMSRAVETDRDTARRGVALIYGLNTLGAVLGAWLTTFVMLERFGNRSSLYLAAGLNVVIAVAGWYAARKVDAIVAPPSSSASSPTSDAPDSGPSAPPVLIFVSAGVVGFAFFLMELTWYRILGPLLGGTIFTFGLILAVALAGIGVGSALYAAFLSRGRALLLGFAITCALEALCIALPYALGDRIAIWTLLLRPLGALGFWGFVAGWTSIAMLVVFPAALVSGIQFPMLISLLGTGRERVARHVGMTYAANTLGAIAGALAGGFGLLRVLGALGCWRLVCVLLAGWGAAIAIVAITREAARFRSAWVFALSVITVAAILTRGPTAAWRHSPIGAGRVHASVIDSPNSMLSFLHKKRRDIVSETDGIESSIGIDQSDAVSFIVNGKVDGNARGDAPTQVMGGLVGAALVPRVKNALVIGLGTGSTAGWLGRLPEIERVDVAEIEPAIRHIAKRCELVNEFVLGNPKVRIHRGDARELLSVSRERYDVIFSEPSNPYRAGVASLYAQEFYAAAKKRLADGGVFVQWLQTYEIDADTMRSVYATLQSVFPYVETWQTMHRDLLLVASEHVPIHDTAALRARISGEPFIRAMRITWMTDTLEGFLGHYLANAAFAKAAASSGAPISTDDRSPLEFGFARTLPGGGYMADDIFWSAEAAAQHRPTLQGAAPDWDRVDYERQIFAFVAGGVPPRRPLPEKYQRRFELLSHWSKKDFQGALNVWNVVGQTPGIELLLIERHALAEVLAYVGEPPAEPWVTALIGEQPTFALALRAVWLARHGQHKEAADKMVEALHQYRIDPWPAPGQMARALGMLPVISPDIRQHAPQWLEALSQPFATHVNDTAREGMQLMISFALGWADPTCIRVIEPMEPNVDWNEALLEFRMQCYKRHKHPLEARAKQDLALFKSTAPVPFAALRGNK